MGAATTRRNARPAGGAASTDREEVGRPLTDAQFTAIAKALSDPRRHRILGEIAGAAAPLPCCALKAADTVTAATMSHHIKGLEAAGLIDVVRDGRFALLSFRRDVFDTYLRQLRDDLQPGP